MSSGLLPFAINFNALTDLGFWTGVADDRRDLRDLHPRPAAQRRLHRADSTSARPASWRSAPTRWRSSSLERGCLVLAGAAGRDADRDGVRRPGRAAGAAAARATTSRSPRSRSPRSSGYVAQNAGITGGNQGLFCGYEDGGQTCFDDTWRSVSKSILDFIEDFWSSRDSLVPLLLVVWIAVAVGTFALRRLQAHARGGGCCGRCARTRTPPRALGKNVFAYKLQSLAISAPLGARRRLLPRPQPATILYPASSSRSSPSSPTRC